MIETDEEGNRQMKVIVKNLNDPNFNQWEQNFIRDISGKKYEAMTRNQKAVITRLYDWLTGKP